MDGFSIMEEITVNKMKQRIISWSVMLAMLTGLLFTWPISAQAAGTTYTFDLYYGDIDIYASYVSYFDAGGSKTQNYAAGSSFNITQSNNTTATANTIIIEDNVTASVTLNSVNISSSDTVFFGEAEHKR